jgi:chloramphenicol-sensitive protein RarD
VNDDVRTGAAVGFGAYLLWGLLTIYWKELHRFDPFELIGYRVAGSGVLLIAVLAARRRLRPMLTALRRPQLAWRVALAAVLLTANWTAYVWAVTHDNVVETALGYFLAPLGTMTLGVIVLGERMHAVQRIAAGLSLGAVAVLTAGYGRVPVLALVIAVSWTFYGLCKRRVPLGSMESLAAETLVLAVPAVALIAWGMGRSDGVPSLATPSHGVLIALAGIVTAAPLVMFGYAARRVPFTVLGPMQYMVPVINFLLGWLAYHEDLSTTTVIGFTMVWVALGLTTADTLRRTRTARTARSHDEPSAADGALVV